MKKKELTINLTQDSVLELYKAYLQTERKDYNEQMKRPIRSAILKAMYEIHSRKNDDAFSIINEQMSKGKRILYWSDLHFNHHNIIAFQNRPFRDTVEMNEKMFSNYYNVVKDDDLVIFGGDIAFGDVQPIAERLQQLPGKKILIMGNHEFDKNKNIYREYHAFDATVMSLVFQKEINGKICNIIVTHYPIANDLLPPNTINIHGHIHGHLANDKNINMAVEHTNYMPIEMNEQITKVFLDFC
jgi:calcineurin-like phosphoesterase family protein